MLVTVPDRLVERRRAIERSACSSRTVPSGRTPPRRNISVMSVTRLTSQLGMSFNPAAPQSAPCIVQHASPDPSGDAARQLSTASLSAARSANGAAVCARAGAIERAHARISARNIRERRRPGGEARRRIVAPREDRSPRGVDRSLLGGDRRATARRRGRARVLGEPRGRAARERRERAREGGTETRARRRARALPAGARGEVAARGGWVTDRERAVTDRTNRPCQGGLRDLVRVGASGA